MLFFRDQWPGDDLPLLEEYLLCKEMHWSWEDLRRTPNYVLQLWRTYRNGEAIAAKLNSN